MSEVIGGLLKEAVLLGGRLITNLIRGESHAHADSSVRSRALRHHVGNSLDDLLIVGALDKTNLREYPAVKYTNLAVFIPCHILVFEKEGHASVHSFHTLLLFYAMIRRKASMISAPLTNSERRIISAIPSLMSARSIGMRFSRSVTDVTSMTFESPTTRRIISVPA